MRSFLASLCRRLNMTGNRNKKSSQIERPSSFSSKAVVEFGENSKNEEESRPSESGACIPRNGLGECSNDGESDSRAEKYRSRLDKLLQGINKWQEVLLAEMQARHKMREAEIKRSAVSQADASFMKEVQRLQAEGQLGAFEKLFKLANACQSARDGLGPLEHEGFEAQKKVQGQVWELQQVEDELFESFASELGESYHESSVISSSSSAHDILGISPLVITNNHEIQKRQSGDTRDQICRSETVSTITDEQQNNYKSPDFIDEFKKKRSDVHDLRMLFSHDETQLVPAIRFRHSVESFSHMNVSGKGPLSIDLNSIGVHQDSILLGLENEEGDWHQEPHYESTLLLDPEVVEIINDEEQQLETAPGSDSGVPDLDLLENNHMSTSDPEQHSSTESFPELLTQFGTKRDRINKWLLHRILISRSEASLIGLQLQKEPDSSPSPWAKLIVAYFQFACNTSMPTNSQEVKNMSTEGKLSEFQQSSNHREESTMIISHPTLLSMTTAEDTAAALIAHPRDDKNNEPCNNLPHQSTLEGLAQVESSNARSIEVDLPSLQVFYSERPTTMTREGMAT
ncbi:uncharacterized protein EAE97_007876 [Botrytis byssoidea]|uniref:Uncharacterized protein n=1 Tax=Botrytis byssoidea TaxID=139641 RepID=A0A9P5IK59_9HELO|nr:uncharacterized protein EAE97_007876 [Botrytis byssoidea]KAF7936510.1 hypothetical protein EAE97_007876 [Botrytis byssoidea]